MLDISVFIGSLRKDSYNRKIFNLYQSLAKDRMRFKEINTADFPHYNADIESDKPAIIKEYGEQIRNSDAVLFISPEYNYSLPGHLKNAIDWLSRLENQPFNGKKAAVIGASPGNIGTARMQYELRKIGVFLNLVFLNKPEVMIGQVYGKFDEQNQLLDAKLEEFLSLHIDAMTEFLASRA